jgi:hypothetical protein
MNDDELLRQYLLGNLPGDEMAALERRLLAEDDLFELAEALEAEVLEDYAHGVLTPAQRACVARFLAASTEGRLRLAVIRGLAEIADRPAAGTSPAPPAGKLLAFPRPRVDLERPRVRAAAIAAMLVISVGAVWLATRVPAPPGSKVANRVPATPLESPLPEPGPPPPPPPDRLAEQPERPAAASSPAVFVATIALSNLRGEEEVPSFHIPARTGIVELRLTLPAGDDGYPSYRIVLNDATGGEVARRDGLNPANPANATGDGARLALRVDAGRLAAGRYSLEIQGVTSEGTTEDLAFPEFEVTRKTAAVK